MISNQRFEAVTFDYGNLDEWKRYFEEIKKIAESCKVIEEFWNELKRKCNGLTFKDLQEEFDYSTVLLGGVTPDGKYKERSLARVYAVLFGFKPENIHDLIEKLKRGLPPTTKIVVEETKFGTVREETEFIRFVRKILDKVMSILRQAENKGLINSADIDVEVDYYGILSDYKRLIGILENFVNNVANILPNYNQKSLFVWTLDKLTYRYMTTAYPELRDKRIFELVKDVLGLEVIFSPDVEDEKTKRDYEVYSYYDGSIGRELVELFKYIWKEFTDKPYSIKQEYLSLIFPNIPNFALDFCKASVNALKSIGYKFPDIEYGNREYSLYKIDGLTLQRYVGGLNLPKDGTVLSLIDVLDCLAPAVMLLEGLQFDLEIYGNNVKFFSVVREYDFNWLHDLDCFYELIRR